MTQHRHLRRLETITAADPVFLITTCCADRRAMLANDTAFKIIREELAAAKDRHGWSVGPFVVMPDHIHFLAAPANDNAKTLSAFVGKVKEWSSKRLVRAMGIAAPVWQPMFYDHLLRSRDAYDEKATYLWNNPVRAGLVEKGEDWPYKGNIAG